MGSASPGGGARPWRRCRRGAEVIYQAVLFDGRRLGYADFLRRVERASDFGPWSYEVWDTKLARHARASAVLQLCMYSDLLGGYQGLEPGEMHLALGGVMGETVSFRVADYAAYYRLVAREFEAVLSGAPVYPLATAPEPVGALRRVSLEREVPLPVAQGRQPFPSCRPDLPAAKRPARRRREHPFEAGRPH